MDADNPRTNASPPLDPSIFPSDALGRVACVLIGGFFVVLGGGSLALLVSNRRGVDAFVIYELSAAAALFGTCFFLWGLFMPRWLGLVARHAVSHFLWIIMALFIPFAIHAIILLVTGQI